MSKDSEPSLVLILKWGGELTPAGKIQAEELGKAFRCMYPGGQGAVFFLSCFHNRANVFVSVAA